MEKKLEAINPNKIGLLMQDIADILKKDTDPETGRMSVYSDVDFQKLKEISQNRGVNLYDLADITIAIVRSIVVNQEELKNKASTRPGELMVQIESLRLDLNNK
ncbi:hypothetical protein SAMN05444405_10490 [Bacteroides luti]|uniref:Uncharacterized protein n=1 Tax=Bacteroides luti TaxID=1297750 RepID=A0A1M4XPD5_9BACE|nr:hypothetical protein [Bacteroides luti]SHE95315.1 hypothetical protein SAMN05444405_10490 [Bacteroides luti]